MRNLLCLLCFSSHPGTLNHTSCLRKCQMFRLILWRSLMYFVILCFCAWYLWIRDDVKKWCWILVRTMLKAPKKESGSMRNVYHETPGVLSSCWCFPYHGASSCVALSVDEWPRVKLSKRTINDTYGTDTLPEMCLVCLVWCFHKKV